MGIPTLISTSTITSAASTVAFTSGIDSTYDEYMFVFTDVHHDLGGSNNGNHISFNGSIDGGSNYNVTKTTTYFDATHSEAESDASLQYQAGYDIAQGTGYQILAGSVDSASDASMAGILHLFSPSNTTYVTHFYSRFNILSAYPANNTCKATFVAGYFNTTSAVNAIVFRAEVNNIDNAVIQLYGIA